MVALTEQLTGEIPGLLRRGSPVTCTSDCDGVVALVYTDGAIAVAISDREIEPSSPDIYALDLTSRTGRFHAREWLAERGHYVGSEDRAEVLAWSVLSVWRGGKPLAGSHPRHGAEYGANAGICDAALLRLGWALTNADGSLTLPPLPEVA